MPGIQLFSVQSKMAHTDLYELCIGEVGENATSRELLKCVTDNINDDHGSFAFARNVLLVFAAAMVFLMQAGFAMICAGAVRRKNVQNTMLKNLLDACGASVAYYAVGFAFSFGGMDPGSPNKTFIGHTNFFLQDVEDLGFWLFEYAFSAAATTIVAGTLAERCQMVAYLWYSAMLAGWVYPVIAHAIWNANGFLSAYSVAPLWNCGMVDFAGSGVVHVTGGFTGLIAALILGPRRGRFHDETGRKLDRPREIVGHSVALQMLGTFILWFGWYGFNCGSALLIYNQFTGEIAALAGVNSTISGGVAGIVGIFVNLWWLERYTGEPYFDLKYAMNGCLSGFVAITAGCGVVEPWAAFLTGVVAGLIYVAGSRTLVWLRIDDAVDAIPVHLFSGLWGVIAVGLFANPTRLHNAYGHNAHPGWFYSIRDGDPGNMRLLGCQLVGALFILGWVLCIMLPFFVWLDWKGWFRSDPLEEIVGLDTSYHGGLALLSTEDHVNPEYISAFKKQRAEQNGLRRRTILPLETVIGDSDNGGGGLEEGDSLEASDLEKSR